MASHLKEDMTSSAIHRLSLSATSLLNCVSSKTRTWCTISLQKLCMSGQFVKSRGRYSPKTSFALHSTSFHAKRIMLLKSSSRSAKTSPPSSLAVSRPHSSLIIPLMCSTLIRLGAVEPQVGPQDQFTHPAAGEAMDCALVRTEDLTSSSIFLYLFWRCFLDRRPPQEPQRKAATNTRAGAMKAKTTSGISLLTSIATRPTKSNPQMKRLGVPGTPHSR